MSRAKMVTYLSTYANSVYQATFLPPMQGMRIGTVESLETDNCSELLNGIHYSACRVMFNVIHTWNLCVAKVYMAHRFIALPLIT